MCLWIPSPARCSELQYKVIIRITWDLWKLPKPTLFSGPQSSPDITGINVNTVTRIHPSHHLEMPSLDIISSVISHERGIPPDLQTPGCSSVFITQWSWNCIYKIWLLTRKVMHSNLSLLLTTYLTLRRTTISHFLLIFFHHLQCNKTLP